MNTNKSDEFVKYVLKTFDFYYGGRWCYEDGIFLTSLCLLHQKTKNEDFLNFLEQYIDGAIDNEGNIRGYQSHKNSLDDIQAGRVLLYLNKEGVLQEKVLKASEKLVTQLKGQPRLKRGNFWHKQIYPYQLWLDGLYMAMPFLAEYAALTNDTRLFQDIEAQYLSCREVLSDDNHLFYYHGFDETGAEAWSKANGGRSSCVWGRALGWYYMSLVDVLDFLPERYSENVKNMLTDLSAGIQKIRDPEELLWKQLIWPETKGNYIETSCSSMFIYGLLKASRKGYLSEDARKTGMESFEKITRDYLFDTEGKWGLRNTCVVAGLGSSSPETNSPYRDGSPAYYLSEKTSAYEMKGWAPYIMSYSEYLNQKGENE